MLKNYSTKLRRYVANRFFMCFVIFCLLSWSVIGQHTQNTNNKADGNIKSSARVNPLTLAMEFDFPLFPYPGRSGNTLPVSLNYSSKVWTTKLNRVWEDRGETGNPNVPNYYRRSVDISTIFGAKSVAGWSSSLQPPRILNDFDVYDSTGNIYPISSPETFRNQLVDNPDDCWLHGQETRFSSQCGGLAWVDVYFCCPPDEFCFEQDSETCIFPDGGGGGGGDPGPTPVPGPSPTPDVMHTVDRVLVEMGDGQTVEFRKNDKVRICTIDPNCFSNNSGTYLAVDSSGLRLERSEVQPNSEGVKDVLYMPDGSKYVFPIVTASGQYPLAEKHVDANGNVTRYDQASHTWTDSLGRSIPNEFPSNISIGTLDVGEQPLHVKGINNADLTYLADWEKLDTVLEDSNTSIKYSGADRCSAIDDNPVGPSLFTNAPVDHHIDTTISSVLFDVTIRQRTCSGLGTPTIFNPIVLASIRSPNGERVEFRYNQFGEITKIVYPTGGWEKFEYGYIQAVGASADFVYGQTNRGVKTRTISDGTNISEWHYEQFFDGSRYGIRQTAPDGTVVERIIQDSGESAFGFEDPRAGMVVEERAKDSVNGEWRSRVLNDYT